MSTTSMVSTARWTRTTSSSICGAAPMGTRCRTRPSTTWWAGCARAPVSSSARTCSGTPTRRGCCARAPGWRASRSCSAHTTRWVNLGRSDSAEYVAHWLRRGRACIDFRGLSAQLKLEMQYAVQCRRDQATTTAPPPIVAWTIHLAMGAGVTSLLDRSPEQWRVLAAGKQAMHQRFLSDARDAVETLHGGASWEVEYPRDIWRLHRLPGLMQSPELLT